MSTEVKPPADGSEQSGMLLFLRIIGLMIVGPAVLLYLIAKVFG